MSEAAADRPTIVYLGNFELPDGDAAALRVRSNAAIFRALGYRVVLLGVTRQDRVGGSLVSLGTDGDGIEMFAMPYPAGTLDWMRRIVSTMPLDLIMDRAAIGNLAMTICYNFPALAQWRISRKARKLGAAAAADITEWYARLRNDSIASVVKNVDTLARMHAVNARMDGLITVSPYLTNFYRRRRHTGPIVEVPTLMPHRAAAELPARRPDDAPARLFFAGSGFDPALAAKGTEGLKDRLDWVLALLAGAKSKGARFHLDIYGVTREDFLVIAPGCRDQVEELADMVTWHGRVANSALLEVLRAADFSIFMRRQTRVTIAGFPTKFSESISHGTPVITNAMPSLAPYMKAGKTGFVLDPADHEGAVAKLTEILSMPVTEIMEMKRYCRESKLFAQDRYVADAREWLVDLGLGIPDRASSATELANPS